MQQNFTARRINACTRVIDGRGSHCYLICGSEKALMVDAGMSTDDIHAFAQTLTDLPIVVVNTHTHFDHTGGNGFFGAAYMHPAGMASAKRRFGGAEGYPLDYDMLPVREGHVFDLGGIKLEVIEIPAHADSSLALLDGTNRVLYTGDDCMRGQILLIDPPFATGSRLEAHLANMQRLWALRGSYDTLCTGHGDTPLPAEYIARFIALDTAALQGTADIRALTLQECTARFATVMPDSLRENLFALGAQGGVLCAADGDISLLYCAP